MTAANRDAIPEWLTAICSADRELFRRPMAIIIDGTRWVFATDGYMFAAIQSDAEAADPPDDALAELAREYLASPAPYAITMAELQKTRPPAITPDECDECEDGKVECEECHGSGKVYGDAPCAECGCTDDVCEGCGGDGSNDCKHCRLFGHVVPHIVAINNTTINAKLLWRVLPHIVADSVRVGISDGVPDMVTIAGSEWRVIIAGTTALADEATARLTVGQEASQ